MYDQSKLFAKQGYISLKEYLADINHMKVHGPWRLPLRMGDRLHLALLGFVARFSWFADAIYIAHSSNVSPAYSILLSYAKRKGIFDSMGERDLHCQGYFSYFLKKTVDISSRKDNLMSGQGVAEDRVTALSKAFGEMIERMVAGVHDMNTDFIVGSPDGLAADQIPHIYPPHHHRFLSIQKERFKRLQYNSSAPIQWVGGRNLVTDQKTLIPRRITQWFVANGEREEVFAHATTNGSAGYFTRMGAVLRGLLEVVQRDGFLVHWLTMIAPELIHVETLSDDLRERVRRLESYGLSIHILNVTSLSIPSVIVAAANNNSKYAYQVTLSGAADVNFHDAIENALREIMIGSEMFYYPEEGTKTGLERTEPEPFVSRFGKAERQLYWRGAKRMKNFEWFISGDAVSYLDLCRKYDAPSMKQDSGKLSWCIDRLKGFGNDYHPVVYFPKNPIQKELGFYVAQVFIPKAFPLYLVEYMGTFDSDRLEEFARSRGRSEWVLNPYPHMFS